MRLLEQLPESDIGLRRTPEKDGRLSQWLMEEHEHARAARMAQEQVWKEVMRQYNAVPVTPKTVNVPIEDAPNIEVPLGAIAADAQYAAIVDLIYTMSPILMVRFNRDDVVEHAKALQKLVDLKVGRNGRGDFRLRTASEEVALDDVQLGTGIYYVPFVEDVYKNDIHQVRMRGPQIFSVAPEDFHVPGGAPGDVQCVRWCTMTTWPTWGELRDRAKKSNWRIDNLTPVGGRGWVHTHREMLGKTGSTNLAGQAQRYEINHTWAYFDYNDDGYDEDLYIVWDKTSQSILQVRYNPYDRRPFEDMRYQRRPHLFWGVGVLEMLQQFQAEMSLLHTQQCLNVKLVNTRMFRASPRTDVEGVLTVHDGKVVSAEEGEFGEILLTEVYPSLPALQGQVAMLAQQRVGSNELSPAPRPSAIAGSRTPGITALTLAQQTNRRFTPAFDGVRLATAAAVKQCLWRLHERLRANDEDVAGHLLDLLGPRDGGLVIDLLKRKDFDAAIDVELTASSTSVNRFADRQDAMMLAQMLQGYYERAMMLVQIAEQSQSETVRNVAVQIAEKSSEMIDRTIRTFDQVRDPRRFLLEIEQDIAQIQPPAELLNQLGGMLGGGGPPEDEEGGGGAPPAPMF